ncbi:MAG: aminotransferase class I/II-fold pyridoxal phosphate-dependent enzyme, partial [Chloroflexi bacterium]|nr:aminotransferase class I/II-fold pyridoxal phosphate-dependent enzyme [Chloroflexota bacterium]
YEIDYDAFEAAITPSTRLFLLCHPHNPTGTDYSSAQLARMGEICLRHGVTICSDEIHCDLMLGGARHTPIACVSPEIAANCITLMAPSKTYNLAGLGCSFAIVQNAALRERVKKAEAGIVPHVNALGLTAALAAYRYGDDWLDALRQYLTVNRDTLVDYVAENLPGVRTTEPQATYLAWLDFRESGIQGNPFEWCLEKAKIAMNDGAAFGSGGEGFVRFNFGCPRSQVIQALDQIKNALIPV